MHASFSKNVQQASSSIVWCLERVEGEGEGLDGRPGVLLQRTVLLPVRHRHLVTAPLHRRHLNSRQFRLLHLLKAFERLSHIFDDSSAIHPISIVNQKFQAFAPTTARRSGPSHIESDREGSRSALRNLKRPCRGHRTLFERQAGTCGTAQPALSRTQVFSSAQDVHPHRRFDFWPIDSRYSRQQLAGAQPVLGQTRPNSIA